MLSRVAESVYWLSRYIERAENTARCIDVNISLTLDLGDEWANQWAPLVFTTGGHELFADRYGEPTRENVLKFLTFDRENPNSIFSCIAAARQNARSVRESLSTSVWEELNRFYLRLNEARMSGDLDTSIYDDVKRASQLLTGIMDSTQTHNEAWHFARLGRLLERGDQTSRILDVKYFILLPTIQDVGSSFDITQWSALLKSASALNMYRRVHHRIVPARVVEFIALDRDFPRSMRFCISRAEHSLHKITGTAPDVYSLPVEQELGRARAELEFAKAEQIIKEGLHEFIDKFQDCVIRVGTLIATSFFDDQPDASQEGSQTQ
ncbi:hypothetical protein Pan44_32260 [Caulifigura coniformis]|uniref:DUF403 domain-containing protein n=1 Tax=Caulifigura coniformis TaxID=2527983 RepID=A0A517SGC6_9PLAN|nr:alpha-E domain-containing protein [Caulifigura coniformis]QDT55184.1 hypothetical protein Pan44_32260 [Caulifigura coniformis]